MGAGSYTAKASFSLSHREFWDWGGYLFIYLFIFKSFFYLYFFLNLYCIFWTHGHGQQCGDCGGCEVGGQVGGSGRMYKAGKWDGLFEF